MAIDINIPSQVRDYANLSAFPATGALKTIYIADDTNKTYRWTGSVYVEVSAGGAGGVTAVTASAPIVSTGGTTPDIQIRQSSSIDDGYLSATDWITFNEKQNALTLTTTGTSGPATLIADTLNIPQYSGGGGGGASGIHALLSPKTGNVVSYNTTTAGLGSTGQTANRFIAAPFIPATSFTSSNLLIRVNTGVALSLAKILIYSDLNGDPNNLLYESTSIDCSTTGNKIVTITFSFTAGETYWLAYWGNSTQNVFTISPANMYAIRNQGSIPAPANLLANVILFGTAPNPITGLLPTTTTMPFIGITQA